MLKHPNIIEYYDSFFHEQAMMIVMEYAAGQSNRERSPLKDGFRCAHSNSGFWVVCFMGTGL